MSQPIEDFVAALDQRLVAGGIEYGDQSFARPISQTVREVEQELADLPGWLYVLWCQAARKTDMVRDQPTLRACYLERLKRRLLRNDRGRRDDVPNLGPIGVLEDIEILAMDCYHLGRQILDRLGPIARAIEVSRSIASPSTYQYSTRRRSTRDPRSDD